MSGWWVIVLGVWFYSTQARLLYLPGAAEQPWFLWATVGLSMVANFIWFGFAGTLATPEEKLFWSAVWDSSIILSYFVAPFLWTYISPQPISYLGMAIILVGVGLLKWGL